jgi:hypothetical protein
VTPFDWTRGRLLATAASLLVIFSEQVLKSQEPASTAAETVQHLLRFCRKPLRAFSSLGNIL